MLFYFGFCAGTLLPRGFRQKNGTARPRLWPGRSHHLVRYDAVVERRPELHRARFGVVWRFAGANGAHIAQPSQNTWALCDELNITPDAIVGVSYGDLWRLRCCTNGPEGALELLVINSPGPVFQRTT